MLRANVGDKYVLEEMLKTGATLGGEQSGHIIFRDCDATTGDGLLTALRLMDIVVRAGKQPGGIGRRSESLSAEDPECPRPREIPFAKIPSVPAAIDTAERELDGNGRVVVRYSGTETLARVMVEAESEDKMNAFTAAIAAEIQKALGVSLRRRDSYGDSRPFGKLRAGSRLSAERSSAACRRLIASCASPSAPVLPLEPQTGFSSPLDQSDPPAHEFSALDCKSCATVPIISRVFS